MTTRVVLCGGKSCCPTADFEADGSVTIIDDDGSKIKLCSEQADILFNALKQTRSSPCADFVK